MDNILPKIIVHAEDVDKEYIWLHLRPRNIDFDKKGNRVVVQDVVWKSHPTRKKRADIDIIHTWTIRALKTKSQSLNKNDKRKSNLNKTVNQI